MFMTNVGQGTIARGWAVKIAVIHNAGCNCDAEHSSVTMHVAN